MKYHTFNLIWVILLFVVALHACKKDEHELQKKDAPTLYDIQANVLPYGVSADVETQTLLVPESMANEQIINIFKQGKVSDTDGDAKIKSVSINADKATITLEAKDGATGNLKESKLIWTIQRLSVTGSLPQILPFTDNNAITAGDINFCTKQFNNPYTLTDGSQMKPSKILVNGNKITADYIIVEAGECVFTLVFVIDGKDFTKNYTLTVNYRPSEYGETVPIYTALGIQTDANNPAQTHSEIWQLAAAENNEKYGFNTVQALITGLKLEWKNELEQLLRNKKIWRISTANDAYFADERIDDSGHIGTHYNDHDESQFNNFRGTNGVSLLSNFDLWKKDGNFVLKSINHDTWESITEIENIVEKGPMHIICSASETGFITEEVTVKELQDLINIYKPFADLLATQQGKITLDIILENHPETVGTMDEAKNRTCDMLTLIPVLLEANPDCGPYIRACTFQTQEGDRNCRISQELMNLMDQTGVQILYDQPNMATVIHDNQSPDRYTINMWNINTNSYTWTKFMGNLYFVKALCSKLNINFDDLLDPYTDKYGHGKGKSLNYHKVAALLFGEQDLETTINLAGKTNCDFSEYLSSKVIEKYPLTNIMLNTPWGGWQVITEVYQVSQMQQYQLDKGFDIGIQLQSGIAPIIKGWKPNIQF